jgi:hypothetical protein
MPASPRPLARTLIALALSCSVARGDDVEDYRRLEAMPLERRAALAENLERFDRLDDRDRAAVRRLDRELARLEPVNQERFRSVVRRYHLWTNGLSKEQREALMAAETPEARFALVRQIRQKEKEAASAAGGARISGLRIGDFGLIGPYEMAFILQVWNKLPDEKKRTVSALRGGRLVAAIRAEANRMKVTYQPFPTEMDRKYEARIEADPTLKGLVGTPAKKPDAAKKAEEAPPKAPDKPARRVEHPYAEFLYFEDPEHRPRPVPPQHFARFVGSCPPWLLAMVEPLTPDDARAYLTALYRLLYPHPSEMPEKAPAPPASGPPRPAPKPAAGPAVPL